VLAATPLVETETNKNRRKPVKSGRVSGPSLRVWPQVCVDFVYIFLSVLAWVHRKKFEALYWALEISVKLFLKNIQEVFFKNLIVDY